MTFPEIWVSDQTIREGMQYRGMMFSYEERLRILEYQEALGIDICQAAYPPAHASEKRILGRLQAEAKKRNYRIRVCGLGRALLEDIDDLAEAGCRDIQLHIAAGRDAGKNARERLFSELKKAVEYTRRIVTAPCIEINLLDVGRTDRKLLAACADFLSKELQVDILTLPDTSGVMAPDAFHAVVREIVGQVEETPTRIGVHCHNDLGMASANTVMGVSAGASLIEVTALGIGERNGIGDIFTVGYSLKVSGRPLQLKTEDIGIFREYYRYVSDFCLAQTGNPLLDHRTPFFGEAVKTHVAGTHGRTSYGLAEDEEYCLNVLCGRHLVRKYLDANRIELEDRLLSELVARIKERSAAMNRRVEKAEVEEIIREISIF